MTETTALEAAIERLAQAAASCQPCAPVRDLLPDGDIAAAYRVQSDLITRRLEGGARRVGRKIGLTSPAVQTQLGVDQPDFGTLLDDMQVPPGGVADIARLLQPKVEGEIAFRLGRDLDGEPTAGAVRAAIASAHASIEIVDSRVRNWDISIVDTVADNASSGMFVVAETGITLDVFEPASVGMTLRRNGEPASGGSGAACLGDPLNAVLWLARTAAAYGEPLRAGEVVLSGALGPMVEVVAGDAVEVEISGLGGVSVSFGEATR